MVRVPSILFLIVEKRSANAANLRLHETKILYHKYIFFLFIFFCFYKGIISLDHVYYTNIAPLQTLLIVFKNVYLLARVNVFCRASELWGHIEHAGTTAVANKQ